MYIRRRLLITGYDICRKYGWQKFVFRIKNNLIRNEYIGSLGGLNSKSLAFRMEVAHFVYMHKKIRAATIIQRTFRLWKKRISSIRKIENAVIEWLYRPGGTFMEHAQDRFYYNANKLATNRLCKD